MDERVQGIEATPREENGSGSTRALPLFVQVVALLIAGVLVALLVNIVVILSSPAPVAVRHRPGPVADTLAGRISAANNERYAVVRNDQPPSDGWEDPEEREFRFTVARLLQVSPLNVRVVLRYAGSASTGAALEAPVPPRAPRRINPFRQPGEIEHFTAGLRLADGSWRILTPRDDRLLDPWQWRASFWFLGTTLLVALLAYRFARRVTAPITRFAAAAERLGRDPNAPPLELEGPVEIRAAAQAFNEMQERLRRYVEDRTAMIGAIAHDLRTPLTRLRFRLEGAPEPLRSKAVGDIAEMEAMVAATLSFVRDATQSGTRQRLELRSLLESIADNMADVGHEVEVEPGQPIVLSGNPVSLRSLFANLLDNAVKYGERARLRARVEAGEAVVRIDDDGPGLGDEDLAQVFEPFYRAERSRNRNTGGTGLGLAVVRSIAQSHGGSIELRNRPQGGLAAVVRLPI